MIDFILPGLLILVSLLWLLQSNIMDHKLDKLEGKMLFISDERAYWAAQCRRLESGLVYQTFAQWEQDKR